MTLLLVLACARDGWPEETRARIASLTPIPPPLARPTDAVADDPDAAAVGARIFVDPGFSATGAVACATCHDPARHFTDGKPVATAIGVGTRNTPTIETVGWSTWFFWDGRADSAWAQAAGPLTNPLEHAVTVEQIRARVEEVYAEDWARLFHGVDPDPLRVTSQVGKVLEAFERTRGPTPGRFDRWAADLAGGVDSDVLTAEEKRGLALFVGEAGCIRCHNGPLFTDHAFHNLGLVSQDTGASIPGGPPPNAVDPTRDLAARDVGATRVLGDPLNCRGAYADPADCAELRYLDPAFPDWPGSFKTPSLRNVAATAPYMHDGSLPDLPAVLGFYNLLPIVPVPGHRDLLLVPLRLPDADRAAIIAFLGTLSGDPAPG